MLSLTTLMMGLLAAPGHAAEDDFDFELEGYYRTRAYYFKDLYEGVDSEKANGRYMTHRLSLQPQLNFEDRAKFFMLTEVLDGVVWGDNASKANTALFAGDPSETGLEGAETDTFRVRRAWMEFKIPVGVLRIGRQPSNWGLGLLANDGDGFDDAFGENHGGSTYDRAIFATKPVAIAQTIAGKADSGFPLFLAVGVDRLVEEPLETWYGFKCPEDRYNVEDFPEYADCDTDGDSITDVSHDYVDEGRTADERTGKWWVDQDDDVMEMVYVLIYRGEGLQLAGSAADLTAGVYAVNRKQRQTDSNVIIGDAYLKFQWSGIYLEGEYLFIKGATNAIVVPGGINEEDPDKPLYKEANIAGYAVKAGYKTPAFSVIAEHGYASGDNNLGDVDFTGRPLHSDYNVGILLYEEVIARAAAAKLPDSLWPKGGVYNSRYLYPQVSYRPLPNWEVQAAYLYAVPDQADNWVIACHEDDSVECDSYNAEDKHLGWEVDFGVKHRFHEHILFAAETAYAKTTDRLDVEAAGLNPDGEFFTFQSRIAYEF